jgi:hypothetical protein
MTVHPDITAVNFQANYIDYAPCVNPPTTLLDFIQPCFTIKKDTECTEVFLDDRSEYNGLDTSNVSITVSVWYAGGPNDEYLLITDSCTHDVNTNQGYDALCGTGHYKLKIHVEYVDGVTTYTKDYEETITLDCCKCDIEDLESEVKAKITTIGCKMHEYESMGKDRTELNVALLGLSNALFYLKTSDIRNYCSSAHNVECFLNSIKDFC